MRTLAVVVALAAGGCGITSATEPWHTEYPTVDSGPGQPDMCLRPNRLPAIDVPAPKPDPVTGLCPPGWFRPRG